MKKNVYWTKKARTCLALLPLVFYFQLEASNSPLDYWTTLHRGSTQQLHLIFRQIRKQVVGSLEFPHP